MQNVSQRVLLAKSNGAGAVFPLRLYVAKCQPEGRVSLVKWGGDSVPSKAIWCKMSARGSC